MPLVYGHRGDPVAAPENTLAAFRAAAAAGADGIECDLHVLEDDTIVIIHDDTYDRTTDGRGPVEAATWDAVARLSAGAWFGSGFAAERLPRLEDVLALARERGLRLDLEVKAGPRLGALLEGLLGAVPDPDGEQILVTSFDAEALEALARRVKGAALGLLAVAGSPDPVERAARLAVGTVVPRFASVAADPGILERARARGQRVLVWDVDREADLRWLGAAGVWGVITDHPGRAKAALGPS